MFCAEPRTSMVTIQIGNLERVFFAQDLVNHFEQVSIEIEDQVFKTGKPIDKDVNQECLKMLHMYLNAKNGNELQEKLKNMIILKTAKDIEMLRKSFVNLLNFLQPKKTDLLEITYPDKTFSFRPRSSLVEELFLQRA